MCAPGSSSATLGASGGLTLGEMELWFARITDLCGANYRDGVGVSAPLIGSLKEVPTSTGSGYARRFPCRLGGHSAEALIADGPDVGAAWRRRRAAHAYDLSSAFIRTLGPPTEAALKKLASMFRRAAIGVACGLYESVFSRILMRRQKEMANLFGRHSS